MNKLRKIQRGAYLKELTGQSHKVVGLIKVTMYYIFTIIDNEVFSPLLRKKKSTNEHD